MNIPFGHKIPGLKKRRWPTNATIIEKTGGTYNVIETKARLLDDNEEGRIYDIKGRGKTKPIPFDKIYHDSGGNPRVFLYAADRDMMLPIEFKPEVGEDSAVQGIDVDIESLEQWRITEERRAEEMHDPEGWFSKHKNELLFIFTMIGLIAIAYVVSTNMVEAANVFAEGMSQAGQAAANSGGGGTGTPPG